jgi:hypothetical protein
MKRPHEDDEDESAAKLAAFAGFSMSGAPPGFSGVLGMGAVGAEGKGKSEAGLGLYLGGKGGSGGGSMGSMSLNDMDAAQRVATTPMDFSNLGKTSPPVVVAVPKNFVGDVMTPETRQLLEQQSGASIEWAPDGAGSKQGPHALLQGSTDQVRLASKLISRVKTHCHWGCNAQKVHRLLKPRIIEKVLLRLSPMDSLSNVEKQLAAGQKLSIGKGKENDATVNDHMISRLHCFLELDAKKGAIYIADCSTNGTYLNGIRLPSRKLGKVLVSHGDELLLKEPSRSQSEFGYIVNISEISVRAEVKLDAPRRLLTADEISMPVRDFQ